MLRVPLLDSWQRSTCVVIAISGALLASVLNAPAARSQETARPSVNDNGTLHVQNEFIPYSDLASREAMRNFIEAFRALHRFTAQNGSPSIQNEREQLEPTTYDPGSRAPT